MEELMQHLKSIRIAPLAKFSVPICVWLKVILASGK